MAKIGIIGNGSIASSIVAKLQDTEQKIVVVKDEVNSILEQGTTIYINNTYHHLDSRSPSKTQLRKCEKGWHEFKKKNKDEQQKKEKIWENTSLKRKKPPTDLRQSAAIW